MKADDERLMADSDIPLPSPAEPLSATPAATSCEGTVLEQSPSNPSVESTHIRYPDDTLIGRLNVSNRLWRIVAICFAVCGAAGLLALLLVPRYLLPAEDAIILFQYSRNLAETGIISFIPHGSRAEGATDFLYMVILSLGIKAGIKPFVCSCILSVASALGISGLLLSFAGTRRTTLNLLSCAGILFMLPPIVAAGEGFSVLPFGLVLAALIWFANAGRIVELGICALLLCLLRPDGVVFAVPLLLFETIYSQERLRRFVVFAGTFIAPGVVYFLWRWHYFGEFFPLPFLVKSNAVRVAKFFVWDSVESIRIFLEFTLVLGAIASWGRIANRNSLRLLLCFIAVPTLFYCTMRLDQNAASRFFFYLPISLAIMVAQNWQALTKIRVWFLAAAVLMWLICFAYPYRSYVNGVFQDQFRMRLAISQELSGMSHQHTMLITEAGILPYYSRWTAYDAWGLNTPRFAHQLLQPEDVRRLSPDLIELNVAFQRDQSSCQFNSEWRVPYKVRSWANMTRNLVAGISPQDYSLWRLPYGYGFSLKRLSYYPSDTYECWFVRRADPDYDRIVAVMARNGAITQEQYLLQPAR